MTGKQKEDRDEDGTLAFLQVMWSLDHSLQRLSKGMAARVGVTGPQRLALRIIGSQAGISPGELSRVLCLHPSTVTGIVQRLEKAGFVERTGTPEDGRRSVLTLTKEGRPLARATGGTVEDAARRALDKCRPDEVSCARKVLERMVGELDSGNGKLARKPVLAAVTSRESGRGRRPAGRTSRLARAAK